MQGNWSKKEDKERWPKEHISAAFDPATVNIDTGVFPVF